MTVPLVRNHPLPTLQQKRDEMKLVVAKLTIKGQSVTCSSGGKKEVAK